MKKKAKAVTASLIAAAAAVGGVMIHHVRQGASVNENTVYVTKVSEITGTAANEVSRLSGVVQAQSTADFTKADDKTIVSINVQAGQTVHKDDVLFTYDTSEASRNIASTNLDIEQLNSDISALNDQIAELNSQLASATGDDRLNYTTEIQSKQSEIRSDQYDIESKKNDIANYQKEIDSASVKSTVDGTVKAVNPDGGTDTGGNTIPIVSITESGDLKVKGMLDEVSVGTITSGQSVIIRARNDESRTWSGTVSQVDAEPSATASTDGTDTSNQASKYPFYVSLSSSEGLMLGQHVYIEPDVGQTAQKDGIWLDSSYLVTEDGKTYVWVSVNNKLHKTEVTTGKKDEDQGTVQIKDGLSEKDAIAWTDDTCKEGAAAQDTAGVGSAS